MPSAGAPPSSAAREQGGPWFYRSLILNFARRDIRACFKGSLFGLLWSLIVPMASLAIYALVFGTFFKQDPPLMGNGEDDPFPVWLFTGLVVWNMFSSTVGTAIGSLLATGPLMKKIYFPAYASVFGSVLATFYQSLIEVGVLVLVLVAYLNVGWTWLLLLVWLGLFAVFVTAVSTLFAVANVYWRDVSHLIGIVLQLMFYLTPIIYTLDTVRGDEGSDRRELAATIIQYLPIAAFVEVFRNLAYDLDLGSLRAWSTVTAYAAVSALAAWAFYQRKGLDLSEELCSVPILVEGVSKKYRWHRDKRTTMKERLARGKPEMLDEFWALKDVSLEVPAGSTFGLVGHNGSGKSTLLKLMAGILRPTTGTVATTGRLSALLELGAGFHPELTGRENVYLNGAILGLGRKQIDASLEQIIDFAGIGDFIDVPVKVYSSGMYVRLGFSIAVTVDPEVLLVDEIVAVGDEEFQRKCFDHLHELHRRGTTIVIVSHSLGVIESMCDHALWLDHGVVKVQGESRKVVKRYLDAVNRDEVQAATGDGSSASLDPDAGRLRRGSGEVRIAKIELLDGKGKRTPVLRTRQAGTIRMHYEATEKVPTAVFGLGFYTESGILVAGPNSTSSLPLRNLKPGRGHVDYTVPDLLLQAGEYRMSAGIVDKGHVYDYLEHAFDLRVRGAGTDEPGLTRLPGSWSASRADG